MATEVVNMGNVVGLLKSASPPTKTYVLWAKQIGLPSDPDLVEIRYWDGTQWSLLNSGGGSLPHIDATNYHLLNDSDTPTIDWLNQQLLDNNSYTSFNWQSRVVRDTSNTLSADFNNRYIFDDDGNVKIAWNSANFLVYNNAGFFYDLDNHLLTANRNIGIPDRDINLDHIDTNSETSGTGFLKGNGSNIYFDNNTYLTAAIQSLNGLSGNTQTIAKGTTAQSNDWGVVSSGTTHTFHFPDASSANRGLLTAANWTTFNNKQAALSGTGFVKIAGTTISYDNTSYLPIGGGTLTGNLNGVTPTQLGYLSGANSNIQNQINNLMIGIGGWKAAARVMTSTNINLSSAPSTIDSVTMVSGDRFVANGQSTASQNGVYIFNGSGVAATRATDCTTGDASNTGVLGMVITIEEGTYADQMWVLTTNAPITVGTTSLSFAKGSSTTYTSSAGVLLTGNNFTIDNTWYSGDATINSSGVIAIGSSRITNAMLAGGISLTTKVTGILPIANGGTNAASVTTTPTANSWAGWDTSLNFSANNLVDGYATRASAASITTLSAASAANQYITGTTTHTFELPATNTLVNGFEMFFQNNSTGTITIKSTGSANTVATLVSGQWCWVTVISTANTGAANEWSVLQSPTLTSLSGTQTANKFWASPISGGGTPTWRTLDSSDMTGIGGSGNIGGSYPNWTVIGMLGTNFPALPTSGTYVLQASISGGTVNSWAFVIATSTAMTNPMTTLGDIIYEDATPTPARLAGNTATSKKFLTQTGNGTISAAPAWFDLFGTANTFSAQNTFSNSSGAIFGNATQNTALLNLYQSDSAYGYYNDIKFYTSAFTRAAIRNTLSTAGGSGGNAAGFLQLMVAAGNSNLYSALSAFNTNTSGSTAINSSPLYVSASANAYNTYINPSSKLHIGAGSTTANTAPLQFTSGSLETTARVGVCEYNGNFYNTTAGLVRYSNGGTIFDHYADVSNISTGETDLYTDTTIANTLNTNGDKIVAKYGGIFAGNVNTKTLRVYFAGTKIFDSGGLSVASAASWEIEVLITRVTSTTARATVSFTSSFGTLMATANYTALTGLTLSGTNIIKITGQSSMASTDLTASVGVVQFFGAV